MKRALVFSHERHEGPGQFGDILRERGFYVRVVLTPEENIAALDALEPDVLLVMGGPMGVYEAKEYPFLKAEIEFLKKRIAADLPTLGICLGSQLIAAALGEKVFKGNAGQEIGWLPLSLTDAGKNHAVAQLAGDKTNMFHWHSDTYELPKGAVLLASSAMYQNQIYSYGRNILGVQCHPEVTPAQAREWLDAMSDEIAASKIVNGIEELRTQTEQNIDRMSVQSKLFFEEWLGSAGL